MTLKKTTWLLALTLFGAAFQACGSRNAKGDPSVQQANETAGTALSKSTNPQIQAQQPVKKYDHAIDRVQLEEMRLKELLPADAVEYVNAASDCAHWSDEEPYDKKREREIANKSKQDCSKAERLKKQIETKYPAGSDTSAQLSLIMKDIEEGNDAFVWNDPERRSGALSEYYESNAQTIIVAVDRLVIQNDKGRLQIQQEEIEPIMKNLDRLSPDTQEKIKGAAGKLKAALR